jgi:hypothetical protein
MEDCKHKWVSSSCQGGEPDFRMNRQMSSVPHAHVICELCNDRTWMSKETWDAWKQNKGPNVKLTGSL